MAESDKEAGRQAFRAYVRSMAFSALQSADTLDPEDAMRLFLPPVKQSMTQIASPLPKARKDWIAGWVEERDG